MCGGATVTERKALYRPRAWAPSYEGDVITACVECQLIHVGTELTPYSQSSNQSNLVPLSVFLTRVCCLFKVAECGAIHMGY